MLANPDNPKPMAGNSRQGDSLFGPEGNDPGDGGGSYDSERTTLSASLQMWLGNAYDGPRYSTLHATFVNSSILLG